MGMKNSRLSKKRSPKQLVFDFSGMFNDGKPNPTCPPIVNTGSLIVDRHD